MELDLRWARCRPDETPDYWQLRHWFQSSAPSVKEKLASSRRLLRVGLRFAGHPIAVASQPKSVMPNDPTSALPNIGS